MKTPNQNLTLAADWDSLPTVRATFGGERFVLWKRTALFARV